KYCYITNTVKVVSELARRVCKGSTRRGKRLSVLTSLALSALLPTVAGASTVGGNNPYQTYRDFAENKGQFQAGATNIPIFNNKGELVGHLDKAPMVDFSSVNVSSNPGVATLINPQYIASVKHNKGYQSVSFGDGQNSYHIVDRNEHSSSDLHTPRLDKLVTEVAPATVTSSSTADILNPSKYSAFYRAGSGSQYIQDSQGKRHWVTGGYGYLTGGILPTSFFYHGSDGIQLYMGGNIHDHSILPSFGEAGDSGSPLFGWNTAKGQWELVGVYSGVGGGTNLIYSLIPQSFLSQIYSEDNDAPVFFNASSGAPLQWKFDSSTGTGSLKQGSDEYAMHGQKGSDLNAGKNLTFLGHNGQIDLENSVTQGAGSLTFTDDYTVTTSNGSTWTGAGIIVDKDASVNWQVNGVKGDNLHKIGEGTLVVQGTGVNEGGLKVGDGTVVLNQQADSSGHVQAFSSVNIASGRPTVVLADNQQVNPDNISWGYRGGVLDVNGNDLTFHKLNAADYGATLGNSSDKTANITLDYQTRPADVKVNEWSSS
ncbi:TPA: vacuolating autotransporter toxin Vat, partial [Escherichia coli]|nr:vacuolating autotransporter toxin Vat [Escherichia coli]